MHRFDQQRLIWYVFRLWDFRCVADVSSFSPSSATHQIAQAKSIPYQPFLIKPVFSLLANAEKNPVFFNVYI